MESRIRLFPTYPLALDRGDIAIGGEADGEGELVPPPLSPTLQPSYFSPASLARASAGSYPCTFAGSPHPTHAFGRRYPYPSAGSPHPTRACGAPPPPPPGAGVVRGDIRWAAVSGVEPGGQPCQVLRRQFC